MDRLESAWETQINFLTPGCCEDSNLKALHSAPVLRVSCALVLILSTLLLFFLLLLLLLLLLLPAPV